MHSSQDTPREGVCETYAFLLRASYYTEALFIGRMA